MVTSKDIKWARYLDFTGPFYGGTHNFVCPENPMWDEQVLASVTATEGGRYDALNMYDRMIVSVGIIQWGEAGQYSVSDMLGLAVERDYNTMSLLRPALDASGATFKRNAKARWRFFFNDARGEVDRQEEQQQLFLLNSNGKVWDDQSKERAKLWAASIANVWDSAAARKAQVDFTVPRLGWFQTAEARKALFGGTTPADNTGWAGALRAGYISFAVNLPAVASKHLLKGIAESQETPWSPEWCTGLLKELTFGPKIAIYPARYNAVRPVLEKLFGVDLPDFAKDLEQWKAENHPSVPQAVRLGLGDFDEVIEYQRELIAQGFDLGPAGADGVMGRQSKEAIIQFQSQHGLTPDGQVGPLTRKAFLNAALTRLGEPTVP